MEGSHDDNEDHIDSSVVSNLVRYEANNGRTHEHSEGEDGVDEGEVHVADAEIFGMDGEVGDDGVSGSREHKEGYL